MLAALLPWQSTMAADEDLRSRAEALFQSLPARPDPNSPLARLGRTLFWDMRLSQDGQTACASCHYQESYGADLRPRSTTARGDNTALHSMTVFNIQLSEAGLRWLGDKASGQEQAIGSITGSMGFDDEQALLLRLQQLGYVPIFAAVFPSDLNALNVERYGEALEAYQQTLLTPSPFDAWLAGDEQALDQQQLQGLASFIDTGCASCHNGTLLGANALRKFGVVDDYWTHTGSSEIHEGLMQVSGREEDRYVFRVASLRNVASTAPYFHDGSVESLDEAIGIMARVQLGENLDSETLASLRAFLEALDGEIPDNFSAPPGVIFTPPVELPAN